MKKESRFDDLYTYFSLKLPIAAFFLIFTGACSLIIAVLIIFTIYNLDSEILLRTFKTTTEFYDSIFYMSYFIVGLLYLTTIVHFLKLRKTVYFIAAILYLYSKLSIFSNGISDFLVDTFSEYLIKNLSFMSYFNSQLNSPEVEIIVLENIKNATQECVLTFLMFDVFFQWKESSKIENTRRAIYVIEHSIILLENQQQNVTTRYIINFKCSTKELVRLCKKNKKQIDALSKQYNKNINYDTIENTLKKSNTKQAKTINQHLMTLKDIMFIIYNCSII